MAGQQAHRLMYVVLVILDEMGYGIKALGSTVLNRDK
jgi:hypothetical protein